MGGERRTTFCSIELYHGDFFLEPSTWQQHFTTTSRYARTGDRSENLLDGKQQIQSFVSSPNPSTIPPPLQYDFVFDYLFFCAISPKLRPKWGEQMSKLLATSKNDVRGKSGSRSSINGQLLTLMFPYYDSDQVGSSTSLMIGPPYKVNIHDYRNVLEPRGVAISNPPNPSGEEHSTASTSFRVDTKQEGLQDLAYESNDTVPERRGQEMVTWWSTTL